MTMLANLLLAVLGLASAGLAGRLLGTTGRGELAAIQVVGAFVLLVCLFGLPDAALYGVSREPRRAGHISGTAAALVAALSVVVVLIASPLAHRFLAGYGPEVQRAGVVYLLSCPVLALVLLGQQILRGRQQFAWWNVLRVAVAGVWLAVLVGVAMVDGGHVGRIAFWYVLALLALLPLVVWVVHHHVPGPYQPRRADARSLLAFGLPSFGAALPQLLNLRLDQLMLTSMVKASDLGLYAAAVGWSWAVNPVLMAIAPIIFPKVASAATSQEQAELLSRASRLGVAAASIVAIGVAALTPLGIRLLYGPSFGPSTGPAVVLVLAGAVFGYGYILEEGTRGLGRPKAVLVAELAALAVTVVVLLVAVPVVGIMGAALASLVGYVVIVAVLVGLLSRRFDLGVTRLLVPHRSDFAAVADRIARLRRRGDGPPRGCTP